MDERYNRLQAVIDELIAERDRALDEECKMATFMMQARYEAVKWRDAYAAEVDEPVAAMPLPWEVHDEHQH